MRGGGDPEGDAVPVGDAVPDGLDGEGVATGVEGDGVPSARLFAEPVLAGPTGARVSAKAGIASASNDRTTTARIIMPPEPGNISLASLGGVKLGRGGGGCVRRPTAR